jgi:tetratricopeptide (TPR) repeat protein
MAMSRILAVYELGSYQEAIDGQAGTNIIGLKQIVEDYGNTDQGELAKIYLGNAYYYLGQFEEALKYYNDFSGSGDIFISSAFAGQANCYEALKDFSLAADNFKNAAQVSEYNATNPEYLLKASINYIKVGNKEDAKKLLEEIKTEYKTSKEAREIDRYLAHIENSF